MFFALLLSLMNSNAWAWGEIGHELVAEFGDQLANPDALKNCGVTNDEIILHVNDPDRVWKQKRIQHRNEPMAHYFHVDLQRGDWRNAKTTDNLRNGFLVYRIADWMEEAKTLRKSKKMDDLKEKLYGLSHYLGDLTQPLHLYSDYDGVRAGLPGIHSQFETKMINRYRRDARQNVAHLTANAKIPPQWRDEDFKTLVFDTAAQSSSMAPKLLQLSRASLQAPHGKNHKPGYVKKILWHNTGALASERLALGARLWARALNLICSDHP